MSKIKGKHTIIEVLLRKALIRECIKYKAHVSNLPGKPDIFIKDSKLIIFVDGEFWHGYKWKIKKPRIKTNREYWINKIEGNMKRDKKYNKELRKLGFTVLRFWEHQIKEDLQGCIKKIKSNM